jgi:ABC-type transporter Mla subunit MlaD
MDYSKNALEQSEIASKKLEGLTSEFGNIIDDLENKSEVLSNIDRSEDIAIETSENLLKTTKQLNDLKSQLDQLLLSCKNT